MCKICVEARVCWYCNAEGHWTDEFPIQEHERQVRERKGLVPIEEPMILCPLCYNAATGVTGEMYQLGDSTNMRTMEKVVARMLWAMYDYQRER